MPPRPTHAPAGLPSAAPAARTAPTLVLAAAAVGLAAAGAAPGWLPPVGLMVPAAAVAAVAMAVALRHGAPAPAVGALVVLALSVSLAWGGARTDATAPAPAPAPRWVIGVVVAETPPVPAATGGWRLRARVERWGGGDPSGHGVRLLLEVAGRDPPPVGARLRVAGRLRAAAAGDAPGWWRRWLERQGISGRLRAARVEVVGRRGGAAGVRDRWRTWATASAGAGLSGDTHAVVRGLALGGGALLSEPVADDFRESGMWHLLAVSGQNVTLVALAVLMLLRLMGLGGTAAPVAAAGVVVAYCLACDGGASVARAGTMGVLALGAEVRSVARLRWALLAGGAVGLLAWQPRAVWDPGFQLSFAAVAGLFGLAPPLQRGLERRLPARAAALVAMALSAGLATAPVLAANFGTVSPAGLMVNLVAVPLAGPVVVLALIGVAGAAVHPWAAEAPAALAGVGADLLRVIARAGAAPEWATLAVPRWWVWPLAALALSPRAPALWRAATRDRAGGVPAPAARAAVAVVALAVAGAVTLWPRERPAPWPAGPALTALDVGQGDALLLRGPRGEALLIDAGPPARGGGRPGVASALRRHGVRRLDALLITHGDADHAGAAPAVLGAVPVGVLLTPPRPADGEGEAMVAAVRAATMAGVPRRPLVAGAALAFGPWRARVLHPAGPLPRGGAPNDGSVVLHAAAGPLSVLLTGDAEGAALAGVPLSPAAVLKVGHHGSQDPLLAALLARVRPRVAVISAGAGNPHGHPHPSVLDTLAAARVPALRTDRAGDITVAATGAGALTVSPAP